MTKVLVEMDPELWSQARAYAKDHQMTNNDLVRLAVERLILPVAGRALPDTQTNVSTFKVPDIDISYVPPKNVTPEEIERRTAPPAGFGYSRPAPKPMKRR